VTLRASSPTITLSSSLPIYSYSHSKQVWSFVLTEPQLSKPSTEGSSNSGKNKSEILGNLDESEMENEGKERMSGDPKSRSEYPEDGANPLISHPNSETVHPEGDADPLHVNTKANAPSK